MKCPKCNNEIEDGSVFCSFCGSPIEKTEPVAQEEVAPVEQEVVEPVQETVNPVVDEPIVESTPVQEAPVAEQPVVEEPKTEVKENTTSENVTKTTVSPEPKKAPKRISLITIGVLVGAVLVVIGLIFLVLAITSKNSEQLFKSAINSVVDEIYVGQAATANSANISTTVGISTDNSDLKETLNGLNVGATVQYDLKERMFLVGLDLEAGKQSYLNGTVMLDLASDVIYAQENNIYDKVVKMELPEEVKTEVDALLGDDTLVIDKKANKKAANYINDAINNSLPSTMFTRNNVTINIAGKNKKVKDNTMTMTMEQFQTVIKSVATSLKMNNDFLSLFKDRNSVVEALDALEDIADETLEGTISIHLFTSGLTNKFQGVALVYDMGYGSQAVLEIAKISKNEYEINLKAINYGEEETLGNAKIVVNKNTKDTLSLTFMADIEDFGNITVDITTTAKYNKGIDTLDIANAVDVENMSEEDMETIVENLQDSALYDILSDYADLDDYVEDDDDYSYGSDSKTLPDGVKLEDNQYFVFNYSNDCIVFNVAKGYEMYADDENYVLYSNDKTRGYVSVVAYWDMDDIEDEIEGDYEYYKKDESGLYKNVNLSKPETMKVGDYTFTKRVITYENKYGDKHVDEYYYTEAGKGRCYLLEVENDDNQVKESEIKEFLTIEVHKK